ncbi:Uncharacterised protein [uncultured archaeon]|nr:Uncharacterised protein [uncultured archaeon]
MAMPCPEPTTYQVTRKCFLIESFPPTFEYLLNEGWKNAGDICRRIYDSILKTAEEVGYEPAITGLAEGRIEGDNKKVVETVEVFGSLELLASICAGRELSIDFWKENREKVNVARLNLVKEGKLVLTVLENRNSPINSADLVLKLKDLLVAA